MNANINSKTLRALLDAEATHNFVMEDGAKRLGLKATKERGTMKVINSPVKSIAGTT